MILFALLKKFCLLSKQRMLFVNCRAFRVAYFVFNKNVFVDEMPQMLFTMAYSLCVEKLDHSRL